MDAVFQLAKVLTVMADGKVIATGTPEAIRANRDAFPGHEPSGKIRVDYAAQGEGWTLTVGDDGIGMPADHADAKPGLGTGIVEALSKQLGASVTVSDAKPGTMISIVHPV